MALFLPRSPSPGCKVGSPDCGQLWTATHTPESSPPPSTGLNLTGHCSPIPLPPGLPSCPLGVSIYPLTLTVHSQPPCSLAYLHYQCCPRGAVREGELAYPATTITRLLLLSGLSLALSVVVVPVVGSFPFHVYSTDSARSSR